MPGFADVLATIVVVAVVVRQFSAQRISDDGRCWVLPGVLLVISLREPGLVGPHHAASAVVFLCAELAVALMTGAGWGWTCRLWRGADGSSWAKGSGATVFVRACGLALRASLYGAATLVGIRQNSSALLLALSVTLAARGGVLMWRATFADDDSLFPALRTGARGYLTKDAGGEEIVRAIQAVLSGEAGLSPSVQRRLLEHVSTQPPPPEASPDPQLPDGMTPREVEVLVLIADGLSNPEIARRLHISQATVKSHINNLFAKAGVRDRAQAVRYAYVRGFARPSGPVFT
ncbi:response regulator transcription factor [Streptomyces sp. NPDC001455]|uniref:response regulator transcription factor n=1 Tax=Streptomyces sp. NPDC001455 TaxID=3154518 RepID=UPI00331BD2BA